MTEKTPAESTPKKRPGCLAWIRRLALAFILLLALALLWLNGPGFRWLAHKYGPDALQKAGFDNSFQVSGTLLGGINLDTLELFSTESPLKHLSATNLQLRYSLFQLKDLTIKSLTADQLTINLDLSQSSPKKEEDPKSQPLELKSLLNKYRPLALHPDLHLKNLHLHVHHDQQNYYQIKNASLAHTPGTNEFLFEPGTLTDFLNASREMDTAKITWLPDEIQVHNLPLTTELKTEALTLHYSPETKLSGQLAYLDSLINFETNLASGGTLDFSGKPLALEPFLKLSPTPELQASANITQLHLKAANLDQAIEDWQAEFTLALDNLSYEKRLIPQATLTLQKNALTLNTLLTFELPEQPGRIALTTELHPENINNPANFWHDSTSQLDTTIASVSRLLNGLQPILKLPLPPDGWPEGSAQLTADLQLIGSNLGPAQANLDFEKLVWGDATLNSGLLQINFTSLTDPISASLQIQESPLSNLQSEASFHPQKQTYKASFQTRNLTAKTLQPFINLSVGKVPLTGSITLDWLGHGDLTNPDSHRGQLELSQTRLSYNRRNPTQLDLSANYEGLRNINLSSLEIREEDFLLQTNLSWNGKRVEIPALEIQKSSQTLLTGNASIPFNIDTFDPKTYFQSTEDWSLNLKADQLDIPATLSLLGLQNQDTPLLPPQLNGIQGTLILDSSLAGSPSLPSLTGRLRLNELNLPEFPQIPPSDTSLAWATAGRSLTLDGTITPDGYQPIVINATSGFHPYKWSENPDTLLNETFDFKATAPELNLAPFAELSPTITLIEGTANIQATGTGTFRNPSFAASLQADIPKIRTTIPRFEKIRATSLDANFTDNTLIIQPFSTSFQGGIMGMSGTILLDEPANPLFDLRIGGSEVLLHRDENINARGDIRLNLDGRLDSARLSGELDLIESVFYKDIELLPLGVPISVPKAPSLPSFRKGNAPPTTTLPIPEPFASWKLDLLATTHDPFRVRGNLTSGEVIGKIKARGILSNPELDGLLLINDFSAALPFSSLSIDGGQVRFRPQLGLLPELEIRATSNIANHDVDIFVNGPSTNPELSFNSNPPLPENEIMTLIATGTTPTGLGDSDTAKGKALQLLIEKVRRAPPGTRLHPFAKFAEPLKDANFEIGGVDPFTGKRRNSVTLPLPFFDSDRWFLSAAIDDQNNTRFLGLYVLRFGDTADSKKTDKTISNLNLPSSSDKPPITQVKLVGLTGLSEQDVFDRLGGRLDFIKSRPPSRASANDADFLVRTLLEKEGYPEVDLRWRIPADRKSIELTVNSGPRFTLGKIDVRGVTPAQAETMAQYFTGIDPLTGKAPEAPYLQSKVRSAAGAANTYLKSLGYWKATSKLVEPFQFDRPNRQVNLTLLSEPGPLHTIGSISLEGNLPKNAQNMVTALQSLIGNTADATSLRRVQEGASATLRELGFQFATTNLSVTHSNGQSDLILTLDPGKRYLVGKTTLTGGESCNLDRVRRYFQSHSRKPFEEEKLRKFKNTLLSTSAFDSLTTERTINKEEGTIDLTLHLKEGKPRGFTYYLGAGSFEGAILGASYYDRNFLSQLYNLNIAAEYSAIGFLGEVSVTDPFWLGRDLRLTPRAFLLSREYDEYSKLESGVGLTLSTQPDKRNTFELDALLALNTSTPESLPSSAVGVRDYAVASIGLTWLHDRRDSGVSPSQGFYSRAHGEVGAVLGETSNGFFRLEGQAAYHWPLNDKSRLAFNLSTGFLASLDQNGFPIDLRYFWGGANSVRSFPARQLGPNINGFPTGGEAFWYSNVEYIRKIAGPLSAVAFLDAGSLDQSAASWPSLDPRLALGLGIRLDLPIGPVRIEYGRSLNPAPEDPPGAFHFAIGAAF